MKHLPALLLLVATTAAARPMSLDDLLNAVRVGDPQLSPDGKRVIYVRTTTDLGAGKRNADIWIVGADGSSPRALTAHEKTENTPRFSPDGERVAFLSNRTGTTQVYLLDLAGGEARKVTDVPGGVEAPLVFSPDGRRVAVVADVYPECADEACNRKRREEADKDPVKVHRLTHLLYRHWDTWRNGLRHHVLLADLETGATTDVTPGDFDSPPSQYEEGNLAFSPDGKTLAFVSNREGNDKEAWTTNTDVWLVPVGGGAPERVGANPAADVSPVFSPDGKTLAVRSQRRPGFEAGRWYIDLYDMRTKAKRTLFVTPDLSVEGLAFSSDGQTIWFTADKEGRRNLYAIDAKGGSPREVVRGGAVSALQGGPGVAVFSMASLTTPADLYRVGTDGKVTRLTDENAAWRKDVALSAPESLSVPGAGGTPVQYWLIKPPGFDAAKRYSTVFLIHGGPQGAWEDGWSYRWCPSLWAAQGWVVVLPNPRGSTGFGQTFVDEISGDWCGKAMADLFAVFDAVVKMPFVDAQRTGIAGASYGGYAVDWILGQTGRFKAAVTHDGVFDLDSMARTTEELWFHDWDMAGGPDASKAAAHVARCSPHLHADRITTPTLVITNELDYRVPVDQGLQLFTVLRRKGVPSEALVFPDEGHFVLKPLNSKRWHEAVFAWMKKYL